MESYEKIKSHVQQIDMSELLFTIPHINCRKGWAPLQFNIQRALHIPLYTVDRKKRGSTFDIITVENTLDFYNFCISVSRKKRFTHS